MNSYRIVGLAVALASVSFTFYFIGGFQIDIWLPLAWLQTALLAVLARSILELTGSSSARLNALPLGFFVLQILFDISKYFQLQALNDLTDTFSRLPFTILYPVLSFVRMALIALLIRTVTSYRRNQTGKSEYDKSGAGGPMMKADDLPPVPREEASEVIFLSDENINSVVYRLHSRASLANGTARMSMVVMFVLVLVGGGASVGLWMSNHVERLRSIEVERTRLLRLTSSLERIRSEATSTTADAQNFFQKRANEIVDDIRANYGNEERYESLLENIEKEAQTSWPDIAIRATIAILTLFLVQIFFSVYKYNRQHGAILSSKAEALLLIGDDSEVIKLLRRESVEAAVQPPPSFGSSPRTPIQEAVELVSKMGNLNSKESGN